MRSLSFFGGFALHRARRSATACRYRPEKRRKKEGPSARNARRHVDVSNVQAPCLNRRLNSSTSLENLWPCTINASILGSSLIHAGWLSALRLVGAAERWRNALTIFRAS